MELCGAPKSTSAKYWPHTEAHKFLIFKVFHLHLWNDCSDVSFVVYISILICEFPEYKVISYYVIIFLPGIQIITVCHFLVFVSSHMLYQGLNHFLEL